ncbi:MAG: tetratricopeptide repeat protein, partial [Pirellulales bacterium]
GVLLWQQVTYVSPGEEQAAPRIQWRMGRAFLTFRHIDYPFAEFPEEITTESRSTVRKNRVMFVAAPPANLLETLMNDEPTDRLMACAEGHFRSGCASEDLYRLYYFIATKGKRLKRCRDFLKTGLDRRPIVYPWHRFYIAAAERCGEKGLAAYYGRLLKKHPRDAKLLLLRAAAEEDGARAEGLVDRAIAADPESGRARWSKADRLMSRAEFAEAKTMYAEAARLKPDDDYLESDLREVRFALGEFAALEKELRQKRKNEPLGWSAHVDLMRVLAAAGRSGEAKKLHDEYAAAVKKNAPMEPHGVVAMSEMILHYLNGNVQRAVRRAGDVREQTTRDHWLFHLRVEAGDLDGGARLSEALDPTSTAMRYLHLCLAWRLKRNTARADAWYQKAVEALGSGTAQERRLARLFEQGDGLDLGQVDRLTLDPQTKAGVLCAMAANCPPKRKELLARARKLNFDVLPPRRFLDRAIAALEK